MTSDEQKAIEFLRKDIISGPQAVIEGFEILLHNMKGRTDTPLWAELYARLLHQSLLGYLRQRELKSMAPNAMTGFDKCETPDDVLEIIEKALNNE